MNVISQGSYDILIVALNGIVVFEKIGNTTNEI